MKKPVPVILDTDIGGDIDDTWALGLILKSPELALKMVLTDMDDTTYKAQIVAKFLERAGRTDVPVAVGEPTSERKGGQTAWVEAYPLTAYPGEVAADGIDAMIRLIMASEEIVTILAIGPVHNLAVALSREPRIAQKARVIGMQGSVYVGYNEGKEISKEWNVLCDIPDWRAAFSAAWEIAISPLDTCGNIVLDGDRYRAILENREDPIVGALIENYACWSKAQNSPRWETRSTTLFDTVPVYMAITDENLVYERLPIAADDEGYTRIVPGAKEINCAVRWLDKARYLDWLSDRLSGAGRAR